MKKVLVYKDPQYEVYKKGTDEFYVGEEAEIAEELLEIAFTGIVSFAGHLKDPYEFFNDFIQRVNWRLQVVQEEINKLENVRSKQ